MIREPLGALPCEREALCERELAGEANAELPEEEMARLRDHPDAASQLARVVLEYERADGETG